MSLEVWPHPVSPYHAGERELHARLGREDRQDMLGRRMHRAFMPDQHRTFFASLPFIVAGSVDGRGWPWASVLFGAPGFVSSPDDRTLALAAHPLPGDPFVANAVPGAPISLVGIELPTRRRNRVNGIVGHPDGEAVTVDVVQSYGNCPKYIHARDVSFKDDPSPPRTLEVEQVDAIDGLTRDIIARSDTFFVASHNPDADPRTNGGVDVNHRGGKPGFVRIEGNTLTVPDFQGNFAFNTLGNFLVNPKAGLLFIDFATGDLVQLAGRVELLWEPTPEVEAFGGAERAWRFHLDQGHRLIGAAPLRWMDGAPSPHVQATGHW